ncbi:MAG: DNRLRE domain-containing protein [Planctomycetales bacterium]
MMLRLRPLALLSSFALLGSSAVAAPDDWAEGAAGRDDGANATEYNRAGDLKWRNRTGDWRDAEGVPQGPKPLAATVIVDDDKTRPVEWDVTGLVRDWASGKLRNKGIALRNVNGGGTFNFHSREVENADDRPRLEVMVNGQPRKFEAVADTYLERSTYRPQGANKKIAVNGELPLLVRFDLSELKPADKIDKATLRLVTFAQYASGQPQVGVFLCDQGEELKPVDPLPGLAAKHPGDRGIEKDPDVLFATGFESPDWQKEWSSVGGKVDTVADDPETKFEPLAGKACRVHLAKGNTGAMNVIYKFQKQHGQEPEEIYFRYYLRFGDDWKQTLDGGKMPGISGTYGDAGWGGRKVNGKDGWSARGSFHLTIPEGNPLAGKQPIGWYCYHADMEGFYGSGWLWNQGYRGFLDNNRWYCVEQQVKMNTPGANGEQGKRDGILRAWIDGRPAFEKTDIRYRDVDKLKIEQIWMNVYHGGTRPSPRDQHLYVDNVVVAKKYIGPIGSATTGD